MMNKLTQILGLSIIALSLVFAGQAYAAKKNKPKPPYIDVVFETSLGIIEIELYPQEAPITVENFLRYIDEGFYTGTTFHRVVPNFVIQGGGFTYDFQRKDTHDPIENEANNGLINHKGTLSMARTSDPGSATTQFFINIKHNEALDYNKKNNPGYAVFGKVTSGFDTAVKRIEREPRGLYRSRPEAPNYPVIIEKAYRKPAAKK